MPSEAFWQGIAQFNKSEFYACHDTLEALWSASEEVNRNFYQGILQIAVGCYHLGNHNWRGAVISMGEGMKRLREYQPSYQGIDVSRLMEETGQLLKALQAIPPEDISQFVRKLETASEESQAVPKLPKIVKSSLSQCRG